MSDVDVGPIDYLALAFPGSKLKGDGLNALVDLMDRHIVRVLDLRFVQRGTDGTITAMTIADFDGDGVLDVALFDGAESGLLDEDDLSALASLIEPGDALGVIVYEKTWGSRSCRRCRPPMRRWSQAPGSRPPPSPPGWTSSSPSS